MRPGAGRCRRTPVVLASLLAILLVAASAAYRKEPPVSLWDESQAVARQHVDSRYGALKAELEEARQEIARLQGEVERVTAERDEAVELVADRDATIADLNATVAALQARIAELEASQPAEPTPGLWYQRPEVKPSEDRVYGLHVTPWFSNKDPATWERAYLTPSGEGGIHAKYGGLVRDEPAVWTAAEEVDAYVRWGVEVLYIDLVQVVTTSTSHWPQIQALLDAAVGKPIRVVPMIDANGSGMTSATPVQVAAQLNRLLDRPTAWRLADGRHVVGIFKAEDPDWSASRYEAIAQATGKRIAYVGAFNETGKIDTLPALWSAGAWSPGADPALLGGVPSYVASTRTRGQVPLMPLLGSGARPRDGWYDESRGLGALRASWDQIIRVGNCWVQAVTGNDFAESPMMPSALHGNALLAYSEWRSYEWRTGTRPPILTPTVFLSHRPQLLGATLTSGQTQRMTQKPRGGNVLTASVDEVEVLTLLPAAARVTVTVGPAITTYDAPAGEHAHYVTARAGTVSVSVAGVEVTSPIPIATRAVNDAPVWAAVWSGDKVEVFDPRPSA